MLVHIEWKKIVAATNCSLSKVENRDKIFVDKQVALQHEKVVIDTAVNKTDGIEDISLFTLEYLFSAEKKHSKDRILEIRSSVSRSHRKNDSISYENYFLYFNAGLKKESRYMVMNLIG